MYNLQNVQGANEEVKWLCVFISQTQSIKTSDQLNKTLLVYWENDAEGHSGISQPQPATQKDTEVTNSHLTIILKRTKGDIVKNDQLFILTFLSFGLLLFLLRNKDTSMVLVYLLGVFPLMCMEVRLSKTQLSILKTNRYLFMLVTGWLFQQVTED